MSVVPIGSALVALVIGAALGGTVLARSSLRWGPAEALVRALLGLALLAAFTVHVALGAVLVAGLVWLSARGATRPREGEPAPKLALSAIGIVTAVAALRPAVPLFWDESVWLAKARVACDGPAELIARATDPASDLAPRGYPIVAGVLEASFALGDPALRSLVAGGTALVVASFALFALLLARSAPARDQRATLLVLALTPLVWVHVRSVQLDLPVGLLAASLFLAVERASKADPLGVPAAITAALLLGIKDEGLACALAVGGAFLLADRRWLVGSRARPLPSANSTGAPVGGPAHERSCDPPGARRAALASCGALALATAVYRLELWARGSTNDDHSLGEATLGAIPALAREALRHAVDVDTWGIVPPVCVAALVLALLPSASRGARTAALVVLFTFAALGAALVVGPAQVRDFALEGTLLNRLGLELLPLSAVLVPRALLGPQRVVGPA